MILINALTVMNLLVLTTCCPIRITLTIFYPLIRQFTDNVFSLSLYIYIYIYMFFAFRHLILFSGI